MTSFLVDPLSHEFMRKALLMSSLVAAVCGFLSSYLTLKGWALMGDAVSHSCLLYTSPSPRDGLLSRMPSSA